MPLCQARLATEEEFTEEDKIGIADQRRAWQVRKYCQARPPTVRYSLGDDPQSLNGTADAAMTALLRGILKQLDADIVRTRSYHMALSMASALTLCRP